MTNAASRKDIRSAEKSLVRAAMVNREVICGLMMIANGREWVYNILEEAQVFTDAFSPEPAIHAYNAGKRVVAQKIFSDVMLYASKQFNLMLEEAHVRRSPTEQQSGRPNTDGGVEGRDAAPDDGDHDPYADDRDDEGNPKFEGYNRRA